jgi:hypothetical protein
MELRKRLLFLFFMLVSVAAGMGLVLLAGFVLRVVQNKSPELSDWILLGGLTAVLHLGMGLLVTHLANKPWDYQLMSMGKRAWLWLLALCYLGGAAAGVTVLA